MTTPAADRAESRRGGADGRFDVGGGGDEEFISGIARTEGVSPRFIYNHPDLRAAIDLAAAESASQFARTAAHRGQVTSASLRADCENTKAANRRLQDHVRTRNDACQGSLEQRQLRLSAWPSPGLSQPMSNNKTDRLDRTLQETQADLKRRDEGLAAARHINRELMTRMNLSDTASSPAQRRPSTLRT